MRHCAWPDSAPRNGDGTKPLSTATWQSSVHHLFESGILYSVDAYCCLRFWLALVGKRRCWEWGILGALSCCSWTVGSVRGKNVSARQLAWSRPPSPGDHAVRPTLCVSGPSWVALSPSVVMGEGLNSSSAPDSFPSMESANMGRRVHHRSFQFFCSHAC